MSQAIRGDAPVVVITGASRGIGLGVGCLLAARNVPLMLTARRKEPLERVSLLLRSAGATVEYSVCDVGDEVGMLETFERAAALGPIGGLLNNAGILEPIAPICDVDVSAFEQHLRTNVTGVLVGLKSVLAHRTSTQALRVVNVSSGAASHGYRGWAAYCSSKAAVNLLTAVAAEELQNQFSAVAIAPGIIETRMQRIIRATSKERFPDVAKFHQLKESGALMHPVDAGQALVWLLCEAPLSLSGQFVDARDESFIGQVPDFDQDLLSRARAWFDRLEEE